MRWLTRPRMRLAWDNLVGVAAVVGIWVTPIALIYLLYGLGFE